MNITSLPFLYKVKLEKDIMGKIGFKTQAQQEELSQRNSPQEVENNSQSTFETAQKLNKSMAHVGIMNRINAISEDIISEKFATLPKEIKIDYVKTLIDQVSLNAELNEKNRILKITPQD